MGSTRIAHRLSELDRLVNDRDVLLDNARVGNLLDELSSDASLVPADKAHKPSMKELIPV